MKIGPQHTMYQKVPETENEYTLVSPRWIHGNDGGIANICWLQDLFRSNRERFYDRICQAVVVEQKTAKLHSETSPWTHLHKMPFQLVRIAADGLCCFRPHECKQGFSIVLVCRCQIYLNICLYNARVFEFGYRVCMILMFWRLFIFYMYIYNEIQ